jgi:alpha-tubulin suppressor-like RCC1 family protein
MLMGMARTLLTVALGISAGHPEAGVPKLEPADASSFAIDSSGQLFAWGSDANGQLGLGRVMQSLVPVPIPAPSEFTRLAAGSQAANLALGADGTLWAWGNYSSRQLGGPQDGTPKPMRIGSEFSGFSEIAVGASHTLALKSNGSLWAWGWNGNGALGDGTRTDRAAPVQIGTGFTAIAASTSHSMAVGADGSLWSWGLNSKGILGNGRADGIEPMPVQIGTGFRTVAASDRHALALKNDGTLWSWGTLGYGNDGNLNYRTIPEQIGTGFSAIAAGGDSSLALKADGSLWAWGGLTRTLTPVPMGVGFSAITLSWGHALAVRSDGSLWAWGSNANGELGDGTVEYRPVPVLIGTGFRAVSAGDGYSLALKSDGSLWSWGSNSDGALGAFPDDPTKRTVPVLVGNGFRSIAQGSYSRIFAIKADDTLWAWGSRTGVGLRAGRSVPVQIGNGFASIASGMSHTLAIKRDGSLWAWGINAFGQLGDGTTEDRVDPIKIGTGFAAVAVSESSSFALKHNGVLYAWGGDAEGVLGLGAGKRDACPSGPCVASPTVVGFNFRAVSSRWGHVLALKDDGSLWAWGWNRYGQLGDDTTTSRATPTLVGTGFTAVAAGGWHSFALKSDGSLWVWGSTFASSLNRSGSQCEGRCFTKPEFVDLGFIDISAAGIGGFHSLALKADGSVWATGSNQYGQLGLGTLSTSSTWIPVVNETATKLFDLTPDTPINPAHALLPFFLKVEASSSGLIAKITDLRAAGVQGDVYFTALLPSSSPLLNCGVGCQLASATSRRRAQSGAAKGSLARVALSGQLEASTSSGMVAGVLTRGGFKQTGGTGYSQAEPTYSGSLGTSVTLRAYEDLTVDPLSSSAAVICMGVTIPELSAKGQVLMRPIATGTAVQGAVQCPPVQTAATIAEFRSEASGPMTARTIAAVINPQAHDRGKSLRVFSWAVAPDGRQFMQTGPNQWMPMTEPMQPAATITVPASGPYRLEVTQNMNLTGLEGTLVFIGLGQSWEDVRNLNKAGHHYTVQ